MHNLEALARGLEGAEHGGRGGRPRGGGFGSVVSAALRDAECDVPLRECAVPQRFLDHGSRGDVLSAIGLTAQDVARRVTEWAAALPAPAVPSDLPVDS
jgi:1-deoxy-D-xylulose-5-phosphate synthase